jgi:hypothetical protein
MYCDYARICSDFKAAPATNIRRYIENLCNVFAVLEFGVLLLTNNINRRTDGLFFSILHWDSESWQEY